MRDEQLVLEAMYIGLLEIRSRAEEIGDEKIRLLADLLHNIPTHLIQALEDKQRFCDVVAAMEAKADATGIRSWLDNAYENIRRWEASRALRNDKDLES